MQSSMQKSEFVNFEHYKSGAQLAKLKEFRYLQPQGSVVRRYLQ